MYITLSRHFYYRPLPEGAALFNKQTNTTQIINSPFSAIIARLYEARASNQPVKKSDTYAFIEPQQADEFIEQAVDLGIIELSTVTPAQ